MGLCAERGLDNALIVVVCAKIDLLRCVFSAVASIRLQRGNNAVANERLRTLLAANCNTMRAEDLCLHFVAS